MHRTRSIQRELPVDIFRTAPFDIAGIKIEAMLRELPQAQNIRIILTEYYDDGKALLVGGPFMGKEMSVDRNSQEVLIPIMPKLGISEQEFLTEMATQKVAVYRRSLRDPDQYEFERIREL